MHPLRMIFSHRYIKRQQTEAIFDELGVDQMHKRALKILFVASRMPSHLTTGDRLRAYSLIKGLQKRGHQVDLLAFENLANPRIETDIYSLCHTVRPVHHADIELQHQTQSKQLWDKFVGVWHGYPRRVWQFHSPTMVRALEEMMSQTSYDVVHFSEIGVAELVNVLDDHIHVARVFDLIDAVSVSVRSSLRYRFDLSWPFRLVEAYHLSRFERALIQKVDGASVVSPKDQAYLNNPAHLQVVPNGIEVPANMPLAPKECDLVFVGNMSSKPNADAVQWFVDFVWPHVIHKRPSTNFFIVGRDPLPPIRRLASDRIIVTGSVDNVHHYMLRAKVFVAPLRFGAGQKNKLLEAFSNRLAVVATHEANAGIYAINEHAIVLRDDPQQMADAILELLASEEKRRWLGENAYRFVRDTFTWDRSVERLEALYHQAIQYAHSHAATSN
jgi:glycosyltransferase involved in cell wall biosynthesis